MSSARNAFFGWRLPALLALCVSAGVPPQRLAAQAPAPPKVVGVRVGFDGRYKLGQWTPVNILLRGGEERLTCRVEFTVADGGGAPSLVTTPPQRPVLLLPRQEASVLLYARFGPDTEMRVALRSLDDMKIKAERRFETAQVDGEEGAGDRMLAVDELIVNLGPSLGLEDALRLRPRDTEWETAVALLDGPDPCAQLPTRWYGYEGVDLLVISTTRPEIFEKLADNERLAALERWVRMGGRLLLSVGSESQRVLAPGEPLAAFAAGRFAGRLAPLRSTGPLESFADSRDPLLPPDGQIDVPLFRDVDPRHVRLAAGDLPVVLRSPWGLGEVVLAGFDLNRHPFAQWRARGPFINKLLGYTKRETGDDSSDPAGQSVIHAGITDLAAQLRGALDQFTGVRVVPFAVVALLVVGYILLIGPGDYFLVK